MRSEVQPGGGEEADQQTGRYLHPSQAGLHQRGQVADGVLGQVRQRSLQMDHTGSTGFGSWAYRFGSWAYRFGSWAYRGSRNMLSPVHGPCPHSHLRLATPPAMMARPWCVRRVRDRPEDGDDVRYGAPARRT